jgi:hypothetical protein
MKKINNLSNWLGIILLGAGAILWPIWLYKGYLYEWYPLIGSFVAIYGGLTANIIFLIRQNKANK